MIAYQLPVKFIWNEIIYFFSVVENCFNAKVSERYHVSHIVTDIVISVNIS